MRNAQVTVCKDAQLTVTILYHGKELAYTIFHQKEQQSEIVETKNVDLARRNQSKAHKPALAIPGVNPFILKRGHFYFGLTGNFNRVIEVNLEKRDQLQIFDQVTSVEDFLQRINLFIDKKVVLYFLVIY